MNGSVSGLCPVSSFGGSSVEPFGSATLLLVYYSEMCSHFVREEHNY
jgi:hypothetical protein